MSFILISEMDEGMKQMSWVRLRIMKPAHLYIGSEMLDDVKQGIRCTGLFSKSQDLR